MPERPSLAEALRPVADAKPDAAKPRGRRGKRGIVTYIETETARQLKVLAAQHDTTLQDLGRRSLAPAPRTLRHEENRAVRTSSTAWSIMASGLWVSGTESRWLPLSARRTSKEDRMPREI